jgi:hypothetical protein
MWRRTYLLLLLLRVYFALSPSYIHPDEIFQGPEVIAGMSLGSRIVYKILMLIRRRVIRFSQCSHLGVDRRKANTKRLSFMACLRLAYGPAESTMAKSS